MSCVLRIIAILIPVVTALALAHALSPPYDDGPRGSENLLYYGMLVGAAFVGALFLRSCLAVIVMPVAIIIPMLLYRAVACADCSGLTYDTTALGVIIMSIVFLTPIVIASVVGTLIGENVAR